ncbi:ABC transporter permease [Acidaminobacter sp. JC074]|uniref:ABC transporter permease n=1 Tax=Acidaminobacter sp. JC074 TaxID=2530199 RepID=UPI001F0D2683|nr:ABC transporter permease [Acidaminobacter sp. JC074]MCH4889884.1 ABC transporter permease [Acidaminobacter sp. JC074]
MSVKKIPAEMWERVPSESMEKDVIARPSLTYWQDAWRRLKQNKLAMLGLIVVVALIIWGYFGTVVVEWKNNNEYENEVERLRAAGDDAAADALFVLQPERKINNGNANLPSILHLYKFDEDTYFYLIPYEFKIILVEDGQIADEPVPEMEYRRYKKEINEALTDEQFASIEKYLTLPKAMHQFKFFQIEDKIVFVPYFYWKEARVEFEKEIDDIEDEAKREAARDDIENKLKEIQVYKVFIGDQELETSKTMLNNKYWFGTDQLGRDIYSRVMYGARISLTVAFVATLVNFIIGVFYGGISGYIGGTVDNVMMRIVDIISTVPLLIYVILIQVFFDQTGLFTICLALGIVFWVRMARLVRGQILSIKEQEYILAARTIGASTGRILSRHLIPNAMGPIIVSLAMSIPSAIFTEAFLSFIGIGIAVPVASWGTMAQEATQNLNAYPYQLFFPALFISATVLAFNFLGDGLRDALDPRLRK